jgi:hypothetical protein
MINFILQQESEKTGKKIGVMRLPIFLFVFYSLILSACPQPSGSGGGGNSSSEVISVTVTPAEITKAQGESEEFSAVVTVTGSAATTVTWSLEGNNMPGTTLEVNPDDNSKTVLTIAGDETAATLTVTATSTADSARSGKATVRVKQAGGTPTIALAASEKWTGTLAVQGGGSASIAKSNGSLIIQVTGGDFTSFVWIVDGAQVSGQTDPSITLIGSNYRLGGHSVTVYALDGNGVPWSPASPIGFTVTAQ